LVDNGEKSENSSGIKAKRNIKRRNVTDLYENANNRQTIAKEIQKRLSSCPFPENYSIIKVGERN
jgi:hypothetical protein